MTTKRQQIIEALSALLADAAEPFGAIAGATVESNSVLPEEVPVAGLIIVRDGDAGEPDRALGGFRETYYDGHTITIEIFVVNVDATSRDAAFDDLVAGIGSTLESDLTLGGLVEMMDFGAPAPLTEPIFGADDVKEASLTITAPYFATTPLG